MKKKNKKLMNFEETSELRVFKFWNSKKNQGHVAQYR